MLEPVEVRLWPAGESAAPRRIPIRLKNVNYVWSAARTGKSCLWPVLDFLLGAKQSRIPKGSVSRSAVWYELVARSDNLANGELLRIARSSNGRQACLQPATSGSESPLIRPASNCSVPEYLQRIVSAANFLPTTPFGPVSSRDLVLLCHLPQYAIGDPTSFVRASEKTFSSLKLSFALQALLRGEDYDLRVFSAYEDRQLRRQREIRSAWSLIETEYERLYQLAVGVGAIGEDLPPTGSALSEYGLRQLATATKSLSLKRMKEGGLIRRYSSNQELATYELGVLAGRLSEFVRIAGALLSEIQQQDSAFQRRLNELDGTPRVASLTAFASHFDTAMAQCMDALQLDSLPGRVEIDPQNLGLRFRTSNGSTTPLVALGGQQNFVGYNIAALASIHIAFRKAGIEGPPPLLVVDQPSQAFFDEADSGDSDGLSEDSRVRLQHFYRALDTLTASVEEMPTTLVLERSPPSELSTLHSSTAVTGWSSEDSGLLPSDWLDG